MVSVKCSCFHVSSRFGGPVGRDQPSMDTWRDTAISKDYNHGLVVIQELADYFFFVPNNFLLIICSLVIFFFYFHLVQMIMVVVE